MRLQRNSVEATKILTIQVILYWITSLTTSIFCGNCILTDKAYKYIVYVILTFNVGRVLNPADVCTFS